MAKILTPDRSVPWGLGFRAGRASLRFIHRENAVAMMLLAERTKDAAVAKAALGQIEAAFEVSRDGGHAPHPALYEAHLPEARAVIARLEAR